MIGSKFLKSGLQHYIQHGEAESRSPSAFDEQLYRQFYPDIAAAVRAGTFSSGLQHYIRYGQSEGRAGLFSGSTGNDIVTGFSSLTNIIRGVNVLEPSVFGSFELTNYISTYGTGEVDTLIGGPERDLFILADEINSRRSTKDYYVGRGSADYGVIKNFELGKDAIQLASVGVFNDQKLSGYRFQSTGGNFNISTSTGDLIGIVEGVTSLPLLPDYYLFDFVFQLG